MDVTYTAGTQTAFSATGALSSTAFTSTDGSTKTTSFSNPSIVVIKSQDLNNTFMITDPALAGYSYMTYGIWNNGDASGDGRGTQETVSSTGFIGGVTTPNGNVPTSGSVVYTGTSVGIYSTLNSRPQFVTSTVTLTTNFSNRTIDYVSTNSQGTSAMAFLNLTGSLTYNAGSSSFSGSLFGPPTTGLNSRITGTANGSFYGLSAQEIGGLFSVSSDSQHVFIGSFGGKRP
jgi:hypothetical protein